MPSYPPVAHQLWPRRAALHPVAAPTPRSAASTQQHRVYHRAVPVRPQHGHCSASGTASSGSITRGRVRGVRIDGTPRITRLGVRVDNPRGTGFFVTAPRMIRWSNRPVTESALDRARRQPRLAILDPNHPSNRDEALAARR